MARRLSKVVPVRVSHRDAIDLREWARKTKNGNVSEVVRELIDERRRRSERSQEPQGEQEQSQGEAA